MATLCYFNIPATGHVNPAIPLVRALVARSDRVIFFDTPEFRTSVENTGAEFRPIDLDYDFVPRQDVLAPFKAMSRIIDQSFHVIPQVLEQTRALDPDLILYDTMCPWGKQVAQRLHKPTVTTCSIMYTGLQNFLDWPRSTKLTRGMLRNPLYVARGLARYEWRAMQLRIRHRVHSPIFVDFFTNPGDMTLMFTSRYFQIGGNKFGDAFQFVGPLIQPRSDAPPPPPEWFDEKPLVYISLGTLFNNRADFFRKCVDAFRDAPYRVLMALGSRVRVEELGALPAHILAREYVLQLEILPRVSAFITHAGMNSVSEAAWYGAPMVLVPQAGDQDFIAYQTEKLGAGLQVDSYQVTAAELRAATERVMRDTRYREQSRKIGESFRAAGGIPSALRALDAFPERRKSTIARDTGEK